MDKINLIRFILVTIPENIANIFLVFLITNKIYYLPFKDNTINRKNNIIRFTITVIIFSVLQLLLRRFIRNMPIFVLLNTVFTVLTLRVLYPPEDKITFLKSLKTPILQACIILLFLSTVEVIYIPPTLNSLGVSMQELYLDKYTVLNLALPQVDRFIQILLITTLWNYSRVRNNTSIYNLNKNLNLFTLIFIIIMEFTITYMYIKFFNILIDPLKILFFLVCLFMSIFNVIYMNNMLDTVDKVYLKFKYKRKEGR